VRLHNGNSGQTYLLCSLVDRRRAHRYESDPQTPENLRLPGHQISKAHFGFGVSE
jgi:hypothetical protein